MKFDGEGEYFTESTAMFYFSEDGDRIDVQYYSTEKDAYFKANNQFSLDLDTPGTVDDGGEEPDTPDVPDEPDTPDDGGFFDAIANFFAKIAEWFKNIFGNLFGKKEATEARITGVKFICV